MAQHHRILGLAALVSAVAIFTGGFVSARLYYDAGGAPPDVVALRYGVAAAVTLPFFVANFRPFSADPGLWKAVGLALVGGAPFGLFVLTGVAGAPVAHGAGLVPGVALAFGTILAYFTLHEPLPPLRLAGLLIALVGLVILVLPEIHTGEARWWGDLAYVGAGLLWGSFTVALRAWRIKPLTGATLAAVFSLPYLLAYWAFLDPRLASLPITETVTHGIYQGIIFNVIGVMLYGWGIARLGAIAAVAAMPLMPVFGALMEWSILDRAPHPFVFIAIALITAGVALAILAVTRLASPSLRAPNP